jgi:S-adenosylmethionine hydrolase
MSIITLTTDMGLRDHYVGVLKYAILHLYPEAKIIDLSHNIKPFYIPGAALTVRSSYQNFPKGTVHLIGVAPNRSARIDHVAVEYDGQYFIGADNGMFPLIFERTPTKVFNLSRIGETATSAVFPSRDIFAVAATHLAQGGIMEVLGQPTEIMNSSAKFLPTIDGPVIRGLAMDIDVYGNIITNIDRNLFNMVGQGRPFEIGFRRQQHLINKLYDSYEGVPEGEKMALFGATGLLEIAINRDNAAQLLGVKHEDVISIEFR